MKNKFEVLEDRAFYTDSVYFEIIQDLVKIDSTWNTLGENLVEFKYNSTNILKRNIKIIKQNNKNCYEDRALLGFGTSIIHIKKYYVNLIKHIKETDDFL